MIGIGEITHYLGDAVALVCARDRETLEEAKKLVKVAYEVLPAVHNPEEAAAPDAPLVFGEDESNVQAYKHVSRGNAEEAIRHSKYVLTQHFHPVDGARLSGAGVLRGAAAGKRRREAVDHRPELPHHHARVRLHAGSGL